jgi:hypothetical protein
MEHLEPQVGERAPDVVLAMPVPLPALVVWLRHVG